MKFIIPQNYNFNTKLFGILDYSTLVFNIIWYALVFGFLHLFFHNWNIKLFLFITFSFPVFLLSIFGFNGENILYIVKYTLKFMIRPKIYLFKKY